MSRYIYIALIFFNLSASDDSISKLHEPSVNQNKHVDPLQDCKTVATKKTLKTVIEKEPIGKKLTKITYSDGSTKIIG